MHPFLDGNGRTGRLLSTLCLYRKGYDFKKLFTISDFYDSNRVNYYTAVQNIRENNLDMTAWLEYFTYGLSTQMQEVRGAGEQVIKLDILKNKYHLKGRQNMAISYLLEHRSFTIKEYESICPEINRRTLQRELKQMIELGLIQVEGATNQLIYKLIL